MRLNLGLALPRGGAAGSGSGSEIPNGAILARTGATILTRDSSTVIART